MRLRCKPRRLWIALTCGGVGTLVLVLATTVLPRVCYYLQRARFHAQIEMTHLSKVREVEMKLTDGGPVNKDLLSSLAEEEGQLASHHARLREKYRRVAFRCWERPPTDLPLPYPWDREQDRRVLETVLLRVIHDTTSSQTEDDRRPLNPMVVVDDTTTIGPFEDWYDPHVVPGTVLPIQAASDLQRRNTEGPVSLSEIKPRNPQIVVDDLHRLGLNALEKYPDAVTFVKVSLPGYSADGQTALVAVSIAFDQHGSGEVFALVRSNGQWQVAGSDLHVRE